MNNFASTRDISWVDGEVTTGEDVNDPSLQLWLNAIEVDSEEVIVISEPTNGSLEGMINHEVSLRTQNACSASRLATLGSPLSRLVEMATRGINGLIKNRARLWNHYLVHEYHVCLKKFFGEESVPPDIATVFEYIEKICTDNLGEQCIYEEPGDASLLVTNFKPRFAFMESHATRKLRELIHHTLEMLHEIESITSKISKKLLYDGCLLINMPEHSLCKRSSEEMVNLLTRLEIISGMLIKLNIIPEMFVACAKVNCAAWFHDVKNYVSNNIFYSMAAQIECFYVIMYQSMVRFTACICYCMEAPDINDMQFSKLKRIVSDVAFCLKESKESIRSIRSVYELNASSYLREVINAQQSTRVPNYSRESRVKFNCDALLKWSEEFSDHMNCFKGTALMLAMLGEGKESETYKKHVRELEYFQEVSADHSIKLKELLNIHSRLIKELSVSNVHDTVVNNVPSNQTVENRIAEAAALPYEDSPQDEFLSQVYGSSDFPNDPFGLGSPTDSPDDEIYVGVFAFNDKPGRHDQNQNDDGKLAQQLYTGVVHQLKDALIPVKSKMRMREREAFTKLYGEVLTKALFDDEDADDEDESGETKQRKVFPRKRVNSSLNSSKDLWGKCSDSSDTDLYATYSDTEDHPSSTTGVELMRELKSKLSRAETARHFSMTPDDEIECQVLNFGDNEEDLDCETPTPALLGNGNAETAECKTPTLMGSDKNDC